MATNNFNTCITADDILYDLPGLIYWKNKASQYIGFNKNVVRLSGLSRKALLGKTDYELNWGKENAATFQKDDQEVMETGVSQISEYEIPIKRHDGRFIIVRTEKSRLCDPDGHVIGVLGVAMDITDEKILQEQLLKEKQKVEELNQVKTQFLRNMEHDIRTPFTGIYSVSRYLFEMELDDEKKELLSAICHCSQELLDYCNWIIDSSRTESSEFLLLKKKFDLKKLVHGVIDMEKPSAIQKKLIFYFDYEDSLPSVFLGDPHRIQRILINIVSNAIKFTEVGYIKLSVKIAQSSRDKFVVLQFFIEDTGIGIPEEKQEHVYEKFSRLNPSNNGKYKGFGLGLNMVKNILEEMDGEMEMQSEVGKGTTFVFSIPLELPLVDSILFKDKD